MRSDRYTLARTLLFIASMTPAAVAQSDQGEAASRAYLSANGMLARGMNELAAQEYRKFIAEQPRHERVPHARYGLGMALYRQRQFDEAITHLEGLGDLKGFEFAAEAAYLAAQCLISAGRPERAVEPLQGLLERHPGHELLDDAGALLVEAHFRAGSFDGALTSSEAFAKRSPQSDLRDRVEYFAGLGALKKGDERQAAERLSEIAERWPQSSLAEQSALLGAQCAHRAGDAERAHRGYTRILERQGSAYAPDALLGLGILEHAAGHLDAAKQILDRLISEHPRSTHVPAALMQRARVNFDRDEYDAARADLARYAKMPGSDTAQASYWTAKCNLRSGKLVQASQQYGSLIDSLDREHELYPAALYDSAVAQMESGDERAAIEALQRFRAECPKHALAPDAAESLATLLHRAGDYEASQQVCEEFLRDRRAHPGAAHMALVSAENAFFAEDLAAAERAYKKFLSDHPSHEKAPLATFRLGCVHLRTGNHAEAEPLLVAAASRAEAHPLLRPALLYLGDIALQAQRWSDAESHLARYIALGGDIPSLDEAMLKRGIALHHLNRHEEAVTALRSLIQDHPRSEHRHLAAFEMSRALLALGRDEAERELTKIVGGGEPRYAALARAQLGSMEAGRGNLKPAAEHFRAAIGSGEASVVPDALHGLGSVELALGDNEAAIAAFERLVTDHPGYARLAEARAERALAMARLEPGPAAIAQLVAVLRSPETPPPLRDALQLELANCQRKAGQEREANGTLRELTRAASSPAMRIHAALDLARAEIAAEEPGRAAETLGSVTSLLEEEGVTPELREHVRYQLAAAEFRQERYRESAQLLGMFLEQHGESPLSASAALLLGESLVRQNQHARAAVALERALEGNLAETDKQTAWLRLGECHASTQNWPASEAAFSSFLEGFPESDLWFQARFGRGWSLENQGKHDAAIAEYTKVTAQHQGATAARAQFQIGECLFAQQKYEEAVRELLKVDILYAYPEWSAAALYEAGRCFEALKQPDKAREQYEQVREKHAQTNWAALAAKRLAAIK